MAQQKTQHQKKIWLGVGIALIVLLTLWGYGRIAAQPDTEGAPAFALDDAYIQLAMAQTLNQGTYGLRPGVFMSASSSPAYVAMLSAGLLAGIPYWLWPRLLAWGAWVCIALLWYRVHQRAGTHPLLAWGSLLVLAWVMPVVALLHSGMEHLLHVAAALGFAIAVAHQLSGQPPKGNAWLLWLTTPLLVMLRFESLFLLLPAMGLAALLKQYRTAARLAVVGLLPLVAFSVFAVANGGWWLPNSVWLKAPVSAERDWLSPLWRWATSLWQHRTLLLLVVAGVLSLLLAWPRHKKTGFNFVLLLLALVATLGHLGFAKTGSFYRYEAYLITLWVLPLTLTAQAFVWGWGNVGGRTSAWVVVLGLAVLMAYYPLRRGWAAWLQTPLALQNISQQQCKMALFVKKYLNNAPVAINDIGAVAFFTQSPFTDIWGLGTKTVAEDLKARQQYRLSTYAQQGQCHAAIIYDHYRQWPPNWQPVGDWSIKNNVVCWHHRVGVYALPHGNQQFIKAQWEAFKKDQNL